MKKGLLLICALLVFVSACGVNKEKINKLAEKCAAGNQEACSDLADIAMNHYQTDEIRIYAVENLTDQVVLADIAMDYHETDEIRIYAVENLTDHTVLAEIAKKEKNSDICEAAVEKLTDQKILAEIARDGNHSDVCEAAVRKLTDEAELTRIAWDYNYNLSIIALRKLADKTTITKEPSDVDRRVHLIRKFIDAFDPVPTPNNTKHIEAVFPAIRVLSDPEFASEVGDIVEIETKWKFVSEEYIPRGVLDVYDPEAKHSLNGEVLTCSIKLQNLPQPLSHTWATEFPEIYKTSDGHPGIDVDAFDIIEKAFNKSSYQKILLYVVRNDKNRFFRNAAVKRLSDQEILAEAAVGDEDWYVRRTAVEKLTDQALLAKIAVEDEYWDVRCTAVKKLTDQALLEKIAMEDEDLGVRCTAVGKLTDKTLLTEMAVTDRESKVRNAAETRLKKLSEK